MFNSFFKYQSLGNDFIILDWYNKKQSYVTEKLKNPKWQLFVKKKCQRNFGIGADGLLILFKHEKTPHALIFNSDGSKAEICLNGIRCIGLHFYIHHDCKKKFSIYMNNKTINLQIKSSKNNNIEIISQITKPKHIEEKTIKINNKQFNGFFVKAPNPHFVIFKQINTNDFKKYAPLIESHNKFKDKTNVEFIWNQNKEFNCLVYERGCGQTLACSSGAIAIIKTLTYLKKIKTKEKITIKMPGGKIKAWLDKDQKINLKANATFVFKGHF